MAFLEWVTLVLSIAHFVWIILTFPILTAAPPRQGIGHTSRSRYEQHFVVASPLSLRATLRVG